MTPRMILTGLGLGTFLGLSACASSGRSPAEMACYDAVANRQAQASEIDFVSTWPSGASAIVTLQDSAGRWNCLATNDGTVTDLKFDPH